MYFNKSSKIVTSSHHPHYYFYRNDNSKYELTELAMIM